MKEWRLYKMTWPEIKEGIKTIDAVLIPVGATEQHGRHMPVDHDYFTSTRLCEMAAKALCERGRWVVVAPTINYGCSWFHMNFPGTITLSQRTFMEVVKEVCESLLRHGFRNLIVVNNHGGNQAALTTCLNDLYAAKGIRVLFASGMDLAAEAIKELEMKGPLQHASEAETSIAMALGQDVRMNELTRDGLDRRKIHEAKRIPTSKHIAYDISIPGSGVFIPFDYTNDISNSGVIGDATLATKEKGQYLVEAITRKITELTEDLCMGLGGKCSGKT